MKTLSSSILLVLSVTAAASAQQSFQAPDVLHASDLPRCGVHAGSFPPSLRGGPPCPDSVTLLRGYPADDGSTVDLMVLYTPAARDAAGGVAAIESRINTAVANTNQYFANSLINTQIRLVRKALITYTESGDGITDLNRLVLTSDGFLDSVHADRDAYGADLVSLWVSNLNAGGVAYQLFAYGLEDDGRYGFSVLRQDQYNIETLAHELGHNFGCQHDRDNLAGVGFYNFSYGYREPGNVWKDIMAYPPGATIPYFSNPNITYTGPLGNHGPIGVPGNDPDVSCNNALTINNLAWTLANFRPSTLPSPPSPRLYVRAAAPPGGSGASWAAAMNDLQAAICKAVQSRGVVNEIWVAAGIYKPDRGLGDRLISFRLVNGVSIYGGFAGNETLLSQRNPALNVTTLSGDIGLPSVHSDNSYHVIDGRDLGPSALLDGFTITAGRADAAYPHDRGGGMWSACGSPTIRNCRFLANEAHYGGALHSGPGSAPLFVACNFVSNTAYQSGGAVSNSGSSASFQSCSFNGNNAPSHGALEAWDASSLSLDGCTFQSNSADWGGALGCYGASIQLIACGFNSNSCTAAGGGIIAGDGAALSLFGCTFDDNHADFGGGAYLHSGASAIFNSGFFHANLAPTGAGLYTYAAHPQLFDVDFSLNQAGSAGFGSGGAAAFAAGSLPSLSACSFISNSAGCCGGAIASFDSAATFERCSFRSNSANYGGALWDANSGSRFLNADFVANSSNFGGGAMHTSSASTSLLAGSRFTGNKSFGWGGVAWNTGGSSPSYVNCTIANNSAAFDSGGLNNDAAPVFLRNSILWANSDNTGSSQSAQIRSVNGAPSITFSIIHGWNGTLGGVGNNGSNPLFVDLDGPDNTPGNLDDNLRLASGSPAIDSARNSDVPPALATDLDAKPRFADDPATTDTGVGSPPIVDRGAYEFQLTCEPCDVNCNGTTNAFDIQPFIELLIGGGPAPCSPCAGDANSDGTVNTFDINSFIACLAG